MVDRLSPQTVGLRPSCSTVRPMPYFSNARTATHSGAVRPQQVNEFACALLDFKELVPKGGQIELNSVVDQNFLATTQICERLRVKTASVDFYFLSCGPEIRYYQYSLSTIRRCSCEGIVLRIIVGGQLAALPHLVKSGMCGLRLQEPLNLGVRRQLVPLVAPIRNELPGGSNDG